MVIVIRLSWLFCVLTSLYKSKVFLTEQLTFIFFLQIPNA